MFVGTGLFGASSQYPKYQQETVMVLTNSKPVGGYSQAQKREAAGKVADGAV